MIRSNDGVHGFSIPKLKIFVQVPKSGDPATVEFTAPPAGGRPPTRLFVGLVFRVTVSDLRILRSATQGTEV